MIGRTRKHMGWTYSGAVFVILITLFFVGCAGGSAKKISSIKGEDQLSRPPVFLIYDFSVNPKDVMVDASGFSSGDEATTAERLSEGKIWAKALSKSLVRQLVEEGITARRAKGSTHIPLNAVVVRGQFIQIDEGDEMKRTTIGFGAGAEDVSVMVQAYQMKKAGLIRISEVEAEAHGRSTPGVAGPAAVAVGAGMVAGLVVSSAMNVKSEAIDGSIQTTVDDLAGELVERTVNYYKKRGWL